MFRSSQHVYQRLTAGAFTGESQTIEVNLRDLKTRFGSAFLHLVGFALRIRLDPTFTNAPNVAQHNRLLRSIVLNDGHIDLARIDGNALRHLEHLESGKRRMEMLSATTSTNPRAWQRRLPLGPLGYQDSPDGFAIPCAALKNGKLTIEINAFANVGADTTAWTGNVYVTAILAARKDLILGSVYERRTFNISADDRITGAARYVAVGLCDAATYVPLTAGDVGEVTVQPDSNLNIYDPTLPGSELGQLFNDEMRAGALDEIQGDPFDATYDVAPRIVNHASPTALATAVVECQPVVWTPNGGMTSKATVACKEHLRIATSGGANTSFQAVVGRFIPRTAEHLAFQLEALSNELGRPVIAESMKAAVLDKASKSPMSERPWLPLKLKVA